MDCFCASCAPWRTSSPALSGAVRAVSGGSGKGKETNMHGWHGDSSTSVQPWLCRLLDRCTYLPFQFDFSFHPLRSAGKPGLRRRAVWARIPSKALKRDDLRLQSKPATPSHPHTLTPSHLSLKLRQSFGHGSRWTPCPSRWEDTSGGCMELLPCLGCSQWSHLDGLKTNKSDIVT